MFPGNFGKIAGNISPYAETLFRDLVAAKDAPFSEYLFVLAMRPWLIPVIWAVPRFGELAKDGPFRSHMD